jgi:hypothetical protein
MIKSRFIFPAHISLEKYVLMFYTCILFISANFHLHLFTHYIYCMYIYIYILEFELSFLKISQSVLHVTVLVKLISTDLPSVKYKGLKYALYVARISNGIFPDSKKSSSLFLDVRQRLLVIN